MFFNNVINALWLKRHLLAGEKIEWTGRPIAEKGPPRHGYGNFVSGLILVAIGLAVMLFVLPTLVKHGWLKLLFKFIIGLDTKRDLPEDERALGLAYACSFLLGFGSAVIGLLFLSLHRMLNYREYFTRFFVTNRRVILINSVYQQPVAAYYLDEIEPEVTKPQPDGSGNVTLKGPEIDLTNLIASIPADIKKQLPMDITNIAQNMKTSPTFIRIPDAGKVCDLVKRLKSEQGIASR